MGVSASVTSQTINVGIIGGSGYTGVELVRWLWRHPQVNIRVVTSRAQAGESIASSFPSLHGCDLHFVDPADVDWSTLDVVFFATPHATAMHQAAEILASGCRVIDLSADFRLRDPAMFAQWYGVEHAAPELLAEAAYGLPELYPEPLAKARLVACAGCYPTAVQLAAAPLVAGGYVGPSSLLADCKSGVTGAGRGAKVASLYSECADSFKAYAAAGHRHEPEIEQGLTALSGSPVRVFFQPHLVPMLRGIHATVYAQPTAASTNWQAVFEEYYQDHPFVAVRPAGSHPATRDVRGSNRVHLAVHARGGRVMVFSVIDNLAKGASSQAVQCLNLMYGLDPEMGLSAWGMQP